MPTRQTKRKLKSKRPKTTPKRRRGRVHAICTKCYRASPLQRESIHMPLPMCYDAERCCFCGTRTYDGIYVRTLQPPQSKCCEPGTVYPSYRADTGVQNVHYRDDKLVSYRLAHGAREPVLRYVSK